MEWALFLQPWSPHGAAVNRRGMLLHTSSLGEEHDLLKLTISWYSAYTVSCTSTVAQCLRCSTSNVSSTAHTSRKCSLDHTQKIILVSPANGRFSYFTRKHVWNWKKSFQPLTEFQNYFKVISATLNMLGNIHEMQQAFEIVLKSFQAKLFQTDIDEGQNDYISHVTTVKPQHNTLKVIVLA